MFYFQQLYKVRIVYKTGYIHDFECTEFKATRDGYQWDAASFQNRPILIGIDQIAAIWQVGTRRVLRWKKRTK